MENLKYNIYIKIGLIIIIAIFLMIPTAMIKDMVHERENRQNEAVWEVSSKWGNDQTISGPIITIPYNRIEKVTNPKDSSVIIRKYKENLHFLPKELKISGDISPEKRHRGIYDIVVYNSNLKMEGTFDKFSLENIDTQNKEFLWDKAYISLGISDLRGIEKQVSLNWEGVNILFNPGTVTNDVISSGINAEIPGIISEDSVFNFSFDIDLKGSQSLFFVPVGKTTNVKLTSTWQNPKFNGAYITDDNIVTDEGFTANWKILHLNRNFPQKWTNTQYQIIDSAFGVDLILPVDSYQKILRTVKYAILFVGFTFLVFFFVEVLKKKFIHPIQYILVGAALIIFYTLLLSITEHLNFNHAFYISVALTILLIFFYVRTIFKSWDLSILTIGILLILYTFIFVIIQLQDYSLLIGSIGIFVVLGLVMFFSRKVDWYSIKLNKKEENTSQENKISKEVEEKKE